MAMQRQRKVLDAFKDRPIRLHVREGFDGSMDISMGNPLE